MKIINLNAFCHLELNIQRRIVLFELLKKGNFDFFYPYKWIYLLNL